MGALAKKGKSKYQIMMREVSDSIQDLALAYGERNTIQACVRTLGLIKNVENRKVFSAVIRLFAVECIRRDLGFYMVEKAVSRDAADNTTDTLHGLNNLLASNINPPLESLNVPDHALYTPIAADWEKYYSAPNFGEIHGSKL